MRGASAWLALLRQAALLWRTGQLRFRLETFGLYYPAPQYSAPWWRVSPDAALLFLRRSHAYALWLLEMHELREGPSGWWARERARLADPR